VAATPQGKNKQIARANSLHHGVILRDGFIPDDVDAGQLVDRTIIKKGWEPAALYIFGDKTLLRVCFWCNYRGFINVSTGGQLGGFHRQVKLCEQSFLVRKTFL